MYDFEFHIAHEVENPAHIFFYKPITIGINTLKAKILDEHPIDFEKYYQFYLNLDGINFSFIGKPLEKNSQNEITFLIKESRIELRRYPRLKTERLNIPVEIQHLSGRLVDISLGGCRIRFDGPIPASLFSSGSRVPITVKPPGGKPVNVWGYIVNVNPGERSISVAFAGRDEKVLKLYSRISEMLKNQKGEILS